MARFLHISDIHLGFDRYDSPPRTLDFFRALKDVIQRYAIDEQVDFVVIAGDLFEYRTIKPAILNQAQICLQMLQQVQIPVLAIEGNHDSCPYGTKTSWLRYLSDWGLLKLLEPGNISQGEPFYAPWDEQTGRGGYIDLDCGVRILGSNWYGAAAPKAIEQIAAEMQTLPPGPAHTVLLFHHGLEGQIARYSGALRYSDLAPLQPAGVDYLALGHIHKQYAVEDWIFNPGSLEANNIEEGQFQRGAYLVELTDRGVQAEHKTDYAQRSIVRLQHSVRSQDTIEEVEAGAIATLEAAIQNQRLIPAERPIVELRITGTVGFDRLELDIRQLRQVLEDRSQALIFLLKYDVDEAAYATPLSEAASRLQIEQETFTDLLAANAVYKKRAGDLAHGLIDLKQRQLEGENEASLYEWIETLLADAQD